MRNAVWSRLVDYSTSNSTGAKFRSRRILPLLSMIEEIWKEKAAVDIVDIGGTESYWNIVTHEYLESHNVRITLINLQAETTETKSSRFTHLQADACNLANIPTKSFDIAHSNSVIEHVGDWSRMQKFASEARRIANRYFIQTPNFWFPIEPHFLTPFVHWMPRLVQARILTMLALGNYPKADSYAQALQFAEGISLIDLRLLKELFPDAKIEREKFLLMTKSIVATKGSI